MADPIEEKLDQILEMLAHLRPAYRKLSFGGPAGSIQLILPDELAYIITRSEDERRRRPSGSAPPATESDAGDSLVVYTITGKTYESNLTISQILSRLQGLPGFQIIHRSYLANLNRIARVKKTDNGREITYEAVDLPAQVSKDHVKAFDAYLGL